MVADEEGIKKAVQDYMARVGGVCATWYVGTARHPQRRLFEEHRVAKGGGGWMFKRAPSPTVAHDVKDYFVRVVGTDGWADGTEPEGEYVYAYKKNVETCP